MTDEEAQGGRIFFSSTGRSLVDEDELVVLSVGVDIGSSTSHLVFSRIVLERLDSRYVVTERERFYQSDILLTPYTSDDAIDADALGAFFEKQYENALVDPDEIDAGALILTGVAVRRSNARRIGELFAGQAGKLVAVSSGDLGALLAAEIRERVARWEKPLEAPTQGIRATVIGASQYTTQVSGSTIFVSPLDVLPLRNLPVIAPDFAFDSDAIASTAVAAAIRKALLHLDLTESESPVAIFVPWAGLATFHRLDAFCRGVVEGLGGLLARGLPVVLAGDGDVGGLLGIHFREEMKLENPVISIDGLELKQFDFIDIGEMLESSGAVPVVIKSLIFPASAALGREWKAKDAATT